MKTSLLCGQDKLEIQVPDSATIMETRPVPALADQTAAVIEALAAPLGSPPLAQVAQGRKNACVVISDFTRPVPNQVILPPILATLEQAGIPRDQITILIATGMHRPNEGAELEALVGKEIKENYRIVNHFCRRAEDVRLVDEIDGAPIEINKVYLDADLKILTGLIEPHMYAGYSGGRKAVLPGISSFRTMQFMHSFAMIDHPGVTNCELDNNPFHHAGQKVADLVGVDFILNVVINRQRQLIGVYAGHYTDALLAGASQVQKLAVYHLDQPMDLVITSAGGYPLDATFYQVSKGLIMARDMLRPGGSVVMSCECREGLGSPEYCSLVREGATPQEFFHRFGDPRNFVIDQWCLQTTYQVMDHAEKVYVYCPYLSREDLAAMGMIKTQDLQATIDSLVDQHPRLAVAPEGPYVVGLVDK